jgi:hypothetical protein
MSTALDLVYQYRLLAGKCETSGLTMDQIDLLNAIEALFRLDAPAESAQPGGLASERVDLAASLRARGHDDRVTISNLAPSGVVCRNVPYLEVGDTVELIVDDIECSLSYRFKGRVSWVRDDDDSSVGIELLGVPLLLRFERATTNDGATEPAPRTGSGRVADAA